MHLIEDCPGTATLTFLLAHGAGTAMDHPWLSAVAAGLALGGVRVVRFEFPYMAKRRADGKNRPPDREDMLLDAYRAAYSACGTGRIVVGGKSMGGRVASMVADELGAAGLVCLGYPFYPTGHPERTRVAHLEALRTPALIVQGTRDPFGLPRDVAGYTVSSSIFVDWIEGAGHDLVPSNTRKAPLGQLLEKPIANALAFLQELVRT